VTYRDQIRAAQEAVAADTPGVVLVDCAGCAFFSAVHYTADGYVELGRQLGAATTSVVGMGQP